MGDQLGIKRLISNPFNPQDNAKVKMYIISQILGQYQSHVE